MKTAIILGATGMIGNEIIKKLAYDKDYNSLYVYTRKPISIKNDKIVNIVTDFKNIEDLRFPTKIDTLFSCLGTTRKKTPDLHTYKFIEIEIPLKMIKKALTLGLKQVHYISSIGANLSSKNYYLNIKGTAEKKLSELMIDSLNIYQPGFLIGERLNYAKGEKIIQKFVKLFDFICIGSGRKYHSIKKEQLATAIIENDKRNQIGLQILHYSDLEILFKSK